MVRSRSGRGCLAVVGGGAASSPGRRVQGLVQFRAGCPGWPQVVRLLRFRTDRSCPCSLAWRPSSHTFPVQRSRQQRPEVADLVRLTELRRPSWPHHVCPGHRVTAASRSHLLVPAGLRALAFPFRRPRRPGVREHTGSPPAARSARGAAGAAGTTSSRSSPGISPRRRLRLPLLPPFPLLPAAAPRGSRRTPPGPRNRAQARPRPRTAPPRARPRPAVSPACPASTRARRPQPVRGRSQPYTASASSSQPAAACATAAARSAPAAAPAAITDASDGTAVAASPRLARVSHHLPATPAGHRIKRRPAGRSPRIAVESAVVEARAQSRQS